MSKSHSLFEGQNQLTLLHQFNLYQNDAGITDILFLAASLCDAPFATINLYRDDAHEYSKAHGADELDDLEFCRLVMDQRCPLLVDDALKDERFSATTLVTQAPCIRMFVGVPLLASSGQSLGTLAVLDSKPGSPAGSRIEALERLAAHCVRVLEFDQLENSREIVDHCMEVAELALWAHDLVNDVFIFNDRFYALLGTNVEREGGYLMPGPIYSQTFCHPDETEVVTEGMAHALAAEDSNFVHRLDHRIIRRDGEERYISVAFRVIKNEKGDSILTYGVNQDITESKTIEQELYRSNAELEKHIQERTEELLEQERRANHAERLTSVGKMAAGVAHDLNSALTPVMLGIEILRDKCPDDIELIELMETNARRSADMISQLVTFSKGTTGDPAPIDATSLLDEIHLFVKKTFAANIIVDARFESNLPSVHGDATKLYQLLMNFCVNAQDAMPDGGILRLEAKLTDVDQELAEASFEGQPGRFVELAISDTGTGIDEAVLNRIFDPYFTTKPHATNSGIGLSTALGIVRGMGGFISVSSTPQKGSRFAAFLPPILEEAAKDPEPAIQVRIQGNGRKVLVVDDDAAIRNMIRSVLAKMHFRVITATDGSDALLKVSDNLHDLSAVLTDIHMPNMDGTTFMHTLKYMLPKVAVVAISGSLSRQTMEQLDELEIHHRLIKPFSLNSLITTLQQALRERVESG